MALNIYKMNLNQSCPFCNLDREIIIENELSFAIYDGYPVNEGHVLIIPKRHTANYFDLTPNEQHACIALLNQVSKTIQEKYNPDGFNIGVNINEKAGQTIPHVHMHLIPRYKGDVEEPRGGVRGVVPGKQNYLK
jgi:diadenosine tetraphosphate (Ap4A) HIT family hydrolase